MTEIDKTIQAAQDFMNTPTDVSQLFPHERMLLGAIGHVGHAAHMRDVEIISGMERVLAFLKYQMAEAKKGATVDGK